MKDRRAPRRIVSSDEVWRGRIVGIVSDMVDLGHGEPVCREYVDHPGAVAVLALDAEDRVALIRQYRHPVDAELWEIPAGLLDVDGEDYLAAAQRELAEETDLVADTWHVLTDVFLTPGGSNESLRVFLAREIGDAPEAFERFEEEADMELAWVPLDDAVRSVLAGTMHSPSAALGILAAHAARAAGWAALRAADAPWFRSAAQTRPADEQAATAPDAS